MCSTAIAHHSGTPEPEQSRGGFAAAANCRHLVRAFDRHSGSVAAPGYDASSAAILSASPAQTIPAGCSAISQRITSPTRAAFMFWATNVQARLSALAPHLWTRAAPTRTFSSRKFYRAADLILLGRAAEKKWRTMTPDRTDFRAAWGRIQHSRFTPVYAPSAGPPHTTGAVLHSFTADWNPQTDSPMLMARRSPVAEKSQCAGNASICPTSPVPCTLTPEQTFYSQQTLPAYAYHNFNNSDCSSCGRSGGGEMLR